MSTPQSPDGARISRRALIQGAGALGLSAVGSTWLTTAGALAAPATGMSSADHLVLNYLPSQPTGWPAEAEHVRNGVGVTIGGHVASAPFTVRGSANEVSLIAFGQPGNAPDPIYEPEPADATIDFKRTLQQAWGAYYAFRYLGGFSGASAISVQSYSVVAAQTATQVSFGCDLFLVYEPDPTSSDPPITADLRWIQVQNTGGRSSTEFHQRANPYYFPGGLTSVYGTPACSFYGVSEGGIGIQPPHADNSPRTSQGPAAFSVMAESFLVHDTGRKDHADRAIIDIYGGVKWGYQVQAVQS